MFILSKQQKRQKTPSKFLLLEDAFGYIKRTNNKPQNFDKQIKIAKEDHAKEIAKKIIF